MLLFVQSMRGWVARHVSWSNSRQAWQERGAGVLLALSALALWRWAGPLPLAAQVGFWCLLLLVAAYLWRRSWVQLFGPVLLFEMVRTGRRRRVFLVRAAYSLILLGILLVVYWSWFLDRRLTFWEMMRGASLRAHDLAEFASSFFYVFMAIQFLTVVWLTPAYTAGAIAVEKERQTLDALLATDLRNREIVLSSYVSRLANIIMLILAGLPILAILQFMGGVDPNLILAGFAAVGLTAISLGALGTVNSLYAKKPRDAVVRTYLMAAAYLILSGLAWLLLLPQLNLTTFPSTENWTSPIELQDVVEWGSVGNLGAVIGQLVYAINKGGRLDVLVPAMLEKYAWFHGLAAIGCGVLTVARFRAKVLEPRESIPTGSRKQRRRIGFWRTWSGRPPVSKRAVLWKEVFVDIKKRRRLVDWLGSGILFAVAFIPAIHLVHFFGRFWPQGDQDSLTVMLNYWVRGASAFLGCAMLLGVAVRAAGCLSGERDRQTLDGLLATPLDNRTILWEKWLGCIFSQRWAAGALLLVWIIGYLTGSLHPLAAACFVVAWLGYAGFVAGLGLWFSVANRSTLRSVFGTLCALVLMLLVLLLAAFDIPESWLPRWLLEQWGFLLLPPATLGFLAFSPTNFEQWLTGKLELHYVPLILGIQFLFWWLAAAVMVILANIRFRVVTGRTSGLPNPPCSMPEASAPLRVVAKQSANKLFSQDAQRSAQSLLLATPGKSESEDPSTYEEISGPTRSWRLASLVERLDAALFLDGPRFQERAGNPVREPACIGTYPPEPEGVRHQLENLFTGPQGPGMPGDPLRARTQPGSPLRAALIPHIDYHRGGHSFAWGFKEVFEQVDASLFVIIGTSHYSAHRFTLTRKDFKTPLGIAPTDQTYIDRLVAHYGPGLFDDELTHLPEHSIELEVVFLQYLYENRRPFRIVPLVVGSFQDCILGNLVPSARTDISRMIEALQEVEAETAEPIFYIISGDLAHIGPKFGDRQPVTDAQLQNSRHMDQALLKQMEKSDMGGYFRVLAEEGDCRRICGFPPTYTLLEAIRPSHGRLLHYDRYVHPQGFESVSFASVGFYR